MYADIESLIINDLGKFFILSTCLESHKSDNHVAPYEICISKIDLFFELP